uniref:Regulatory protein zeste n=1 Tax=Graphocephala atropunctata TaxID=36148 RepID=A0A1B6KKS9_9HEMI
MEVKTISCNMLDFGKVKIDGRKNRSKNFSESEVVHLLDLVSKYSEILDKKAFDKITLKEKESVWNNIEHQFNNLSGSFYRDAKTLRNKYDNIRKTSKRKCVDDKKYVLATDTGPSQIISSVAETGFTVQESLGSNSVIGLPTHYDSDDGSSSFSNSLPIMSEEGNEQVAADSPSPPQENTANLSTAVGTPAAKPNEVNCEIEFGSDLSVTNLKLKASSPLITNKKVGLPVFDKTTASKKAVKLSDANKKLLVLQQQIKFQQEEHDLRMGFH